MCPISPELFGELKGEFFDCDLKVRQRKRVKADGEMVCTWQFYGSPKGHDRLAERPFARPDVEKFSV